MRCKAAVVIELPYMYFGLFRGLQKSVIKDVPIGFLILEEHN